MIVTLAIHDTTKARRGSLRIIYKILPNGDEVTTWTWVGSPSNTMTGEWEWQFLPDIGAYALNLFDADDNAHVLPIATLFDDWNFPKFQDAPATPWFDGHAHSSGELSVFINSSIAITSKFTWRV